MASITSIERSPSTRSGESVSFDERNRKINEALSIVKVLAQQVGNTLPIVPINSVNELSSDPGVYVIDDEQKANNNVVSASFEFTPENLSGAVDSAHAVIPGNLTVNRKNSEPTTSTVVAKCFTKRGFDDRFERVKREITTMQAMKEHGELTLSPIAVVMAHMGGEEQIVLLTDFYDDPKLLTLDNNPWGRGMTPSNIENAITGATALGRFNRLGFSHGDGKIKNAAQDETGKSGMIDYETSLPINVDDPDEVAEAAYTDLSKFLDSLVDRGFFGVKPDGKPAMEIREALDAIVLSYADQWLGSSDLILEAVWNATKSAIDSALPGVRKHQGYYQF